MQVKAIYENGVFKPFQKLNLNDHDEVILYFWKDIKTQIDLENAYKEASQEREDLKEWDSTDIENWS